jgi:hypothetical protein
MGKNGCNNVGVTIKYLLNQDPTTTKIPATKAALGFRPFLKIKISIGMIIAVEMANQNMGAYSPVNKPNK